MKYLIDEIWEAMRDGGLEYSERINLNEKSLQTVLYEYEQIFEQEGDIDQLKQYFGVSVTVSKSQQEPFKLD